VTLRPSLSAGLPLSRNGSLGSRVATAKRGSRSLSCKSPASAWQLAWEGEGVEKPLEFRLDRGWPGTGCAGIGQIARNRVVTGAEVRQYPEMPASLPGPFDRGSERQKNSNREVGWVWISCARIFACA